MLIEISEARIPTSSDFGLGRSVTLSGGHLGCVEWWYLSTTGGGSFSEKAAKEKWEGATHGPWWQTLTLEASLEGT